MLFFILLLALAFGSSATCPTGFQKVSNSCLLQNDTAVSWDDAWTFCKDVDAGANLIIIDSSEQNGQMSALWSGSSDTYFWIGGTDQGWKTRDGTFTAYTDQQFFVGGSTASANMGASIDHDYVRFKISSGEWDFVTNAEKYGFVCEIELSTCYNDLNLTWPVGNYRTVWGLQAVDETTTMSCPPNYSGNQTRFCGTDAQYDTPDVSECHAVIENAGWTDDTAFTDSFGWNFNKASAKGHGPFTDGDYNTKNFDISGVDMDTYPYIYVTFNVAGEGAWAGAVELHVDGNFVVSEAAGVNTTKIEATVGRELFNLNNTFELTLNATYPGGASTDKIYITDLQLIPYTRQMMSENCYRTYAYNESTSYPLFDQQLSGFLSEADDLTIQFTIPRELYDVKIEFVGQTKDQTIGYSDSIAATSLWESDRETTANTRCGTEMWLADLPWTSLSNVFTSVQDFHNGTDLITNESEDYYVFQAELNITASEKVVAINNNSPRSWTLVRETTWRYPFALKWRRDISIETDLTVHVCDVGHTICTIRHVAAIISFVQTHVNPIAELSGQSIGTVVLGIKTLIAYPYMFITNRAGDDPPNDQISTNSNLSDYTEANSLYASWGGPIIVASPDVMTWDGKTQLQEVNTTMQFQWENTESCTHNASLAVNFQTDKECEQNWSLELKPEAGSCFVNGNYTIQWSARCMYNKPVCVFLKDGSKYQNGVETTLKVRSTQMCPSLVQDVDVDGYLCSAGRQVDNLGYATGCHSDPTYVQGEETHFITEISSTLATIVKTEIIEIKATQDYSTWNTADAISAGLIPQYDNSWDGTQTLWVEGNGIDTTADWPLFEADNTPSGVDPLNENRKVIMEVVNSDQDVAFADNFAGFLVKLDSYIFPAPHDRSSDITFTVVLRITYQGFDDFTNTDRSTGVLSGDDFGGNNDYSWCAGARHDFNDTHEDATDAQITTLFCTEYDAACCQCPDTCSGEASCSVVDCSATRRQLKTATVRRRLKTVIQDGQDETSLSTRIAVQPSIAEITGHVDANSKAVKFTLEMNVNSHMIDTFTYDRPAFYRTMEFELSRLSLAANGQQLQCKQISTSTENGRDSLKVIVEIAKLNVDEEDLLPYRVAQNLERAIQNGAIYQVAFFERTEVYSMEYHSIDSTPNKVHFGHVDPISSETDYEHDGVSSLGLFLVFVSFVLLW